MSAFPVSNNAAAETPGGRGFHFANPTALLEAIVRSSQDAIITKDLNGIITSWNPAATRILGYQADEMIGQPVLRLIPERLKYEEAEILRKLRAGERIDHHETIRATKTGKELIVSLTISPLKNERGEIVGGSKILRDVTEQRARERAQAHLAAIVESSDDAILSKDLNGVITSWNGAAERIFGYTAEEAVGQSILMLLPEELKPEEQVILAKLRAGERIEHYETVRVAKDGTRLDMSLTISPMRNSEGVIFGASKIARNISERKRMEQSLIQAEKLAAGGKMAATIAHEINNPLEAVLNLIYLARTSSPDAKQVDSYLVTAEEELVRLAHIAKQTLGFYRETANAMPLPLTLLAENALRIYGPRLQQAHIKIETKFASQRKVPLKRGEVMQVISNVISNAIAAMPYGGTLRVAVNDTVDEGRDGICLSICDTGIGISEEHLQRIFDPFFTTREAVGTGIGLWVAKKFIEGHGGCIRVNSSTDVELHGTTMSIFLPIVNPYSADVPEEMSTARPN